MVIMTGMKSFLWLKRLLLRVNQMSQKQKRVDVFPSQVTVKACYYDVIPRQVPVFPTKRVSINGVGSGSLLD